MSAQPKRPVALRTFYFLHFMAVGVSLPFFPGYFEFLGFSGARSGALLSVDPMLAAVLPPVFGQLADRSRRPGLVLALCAAGATLGYVLLSLAGSFPQAFAALCVHAAFAGAIASLADSITLHQVERSGGTYAATRVWGSLGFIVAALPFGFLIDVIDRRAVLVPLALTLINAVLAAVFLAPQRVEAHPGPSPTWRNAAALLRKPELWLFLVATALHWIACAPYNGSLAPHVAALGLPPSVVGLSASVGVASEVLVMFTWHRWSAFVSPRKLLTLCFVASAGRWALMAVTDSPALLIASNVIHGLTFGAFYLASVQWMATHAPGSLRATGQAIYVTVTFGIGGVIGYRGGGALFDRLGGHALFGVAAIIALSPVLVLALLPASDARRAAAE